MTFNDTFTASIEQNHQLTVGNLYQPEANTSHPVVYSPQHKALVTINGNPLAFSRESAISLVRQEKPFVKGALVTFMIVRHVHSTRYMMGPKQAVTLYDYDEPKNRATSVVYDNKTGIIYAAGLNQTDSHALIERSHERLGMKNLQAIMHLTFAQHCSETIQDIVGCRISELNNCSYACN
ncbi:hypothetical protein [Vibrio sp. R78045]|uniref:hypothetical protein n=1 Tax=Vibrio sp. R78045 TaxID=3093868 RepID=UPI0036F34DD8